MKLSGSKRIAERYVKALFDTASEADALGAVEKDLKTLGQALETTPSFQDFLHNPLLSRENQAQSMTAILNNVGADTITQQFFALLARRRRLAILPEIMKQFCALVAEGRGEMAAELVSATELSAADITSISERLSKAYNKKVVLHVRHDPELLGGIVLHVGSLRFDASLSGKLNRLQMGLKAA